MESISMKTPLLNNEEAKLLNKKELKKYVIKCKIACKEVENRMSNFEEYKVKFNESVRVYKNKIDESMKLQKKDEALLVNIRLKVQNHNKELLDYYTKKIDIITQYYIDNNIYETNYEHLDVDNDINYVTMLYLRYNYNCGVLNHELGNYKEALKYYEEAAYNKYPPAQKALSYCYKYGIYYEHSIKKATMWYKLYQEQMLEHPSIKYSTQKIEIEDVD